MEIETKYDWEKELMVPPGCRAVVSVHVEPRDGGCVIFGYQGDEILRPIVVEGSKAHLELPFTHPQVFVKLLQGTDRVTIEEEGWVDLSLR